METPPPFPLAAASRTCMKKFDSLVTNLDVAADRHTKLMSPGIVKNQRDRFRVWAGNLGALQKGRASLDFRLRESGLMHTTILKLLQQLADSITRSNEVVRGLRLPLEEQFANEETDEERLGEDEQDWEESSSNESEANDEDQNDEDQFDTNTELGQNLSEMVLIISNLFKLSFHIRQATDRSSALSALKAHRHEEKVFVDGTTEVDRLASYAAFDQNYVQESFRSFRRTFGGQKELDVNAEAANPDRQLIERWERSITNRRRQFAYWQRHAQKLARQDHEEAEGTQQPIREHVTSSSLSGATQPVQPAVELEPPTRSWKPPSTVDRTILSGTEATTYARALDDDIDTQSVISYTSTAYDVNGDTTELPAPPPTSYLQTEFICPYCWIVYPIRYATGNHWREHILQDIQPYMCTYADCPEADTMYASRSAWLEHERKTHRKKWHCFEHGEQLLSSRDALIRHFEKAHGNLGELMETMADFGHVEIKDDRTRCPFCESVGPFKKGLANHMAFHMEKLASFSVPRNKDMEEDGSSKGTGSAAAAAAEGTRSADSLASVTLHFSSAGSRRSSSSVTGSTNPHFKREQRSNEGAPERTGVILEWLTPIDYSAEHEFFLRQREPRTGLWLLQSPEFQTWIQKSQQTLFCQGIPGAGKTIATSIVVDHLMTMYRDDPTLGIAYIYCSHKRESEQSPASLLANLLKQLILRLDILPECVGDLYEHHAQGKTQPTVDELSQTLAKVAALHSRVFIVIDALDECQDSDGCRSQFLDEVFKLEGTTETSLMATSRSIPRIAEKFSEALLLDIRANNEDMRTYVDAHLPPVPPHWSSGLGSFDGKINSFIKDADGMFSCVRSLVENKANIDLNQAMEMVDTTPQVLSIWEDAVGRIERQPPSQAQLAKKTISLITSAKQQLTRSELQHAVALAPGDRVFDVKRMPRVQDIISACVGLVSGHREEISLLGFAHDAIRRYFTLDMIDVRLKPTAPVQDGIVTTCVTYLLLDHFNGGQCPTEELLKERLRHHPFYSYASRYWGEHARSASLGQDVLEFLQDGKKVEASYQAMRFRESRTGRDYRPGSMFLRDTAKYVTGLHLAAYFGLEDAARALLRGGFDPNLKDSHGRSPLSYVAETGWGNVAKLLVDIENVDVDVRDEDGESPLMIAAMHGQASVAKILLETGHVEVDARDKDGRSPLMVAAVYGRANIVKVLLETGQVEVDARDKDGRSPLIIAAQNGNASVVRVLLETGRVEVDARDKDGRSPLIMAAQTGNAGIVKSLLETGQVEVDARDKNGRSPLMIAAQIGNAGIVKSLLETGQVEVDARDKDGRSPLMIAAQIGNAGIVKSLLETGQVEVDARDKDGRSPLIMAARNGDASVVKVLLETGQVEIDARDKNGRSPLLMAARNGYASVVEVLLETGQVEVDARDKDGRSPLMVAVDYGRANVVKSLLKTGQVDVNLKDKNGATALSIATQNGDATLAQLFKDSNADAMVAGRALIIERS